MRLRRIVGWFAFGLLGLIAALAIILLLVDVTVYRGPLQAGVSALINRPVKLDGEMSLTPSLWPTIVVEDVHVANPEWASRPNFASAERLEFQVALLPLIWGDLRVLNIVLDGADILLEGRPDGINNWRFKEKKPEEPRKLLDIRSLTVRRCVIGYRSSADHVYRFAVADAEGVLTKREQVQIQGTGEYRDLPFTLSLLGGTAAEFMAAKPWPVKLMARIAETTVNAEGIVTRPLEGAGFDLQVSVEGTQFGELAALFGIALPALGPFEFSARIAETAERYSVTALTGRLGNTDTLQPITVTKGTMLVPYAEPVELDVEGKYGDAPFNVSFAGGSLNALRNRRQPWPAKAEAQAAGATLTIDGQVATQTSAPGLDAAVTLNGREFGDLSPLLGANLPRLGPYELSAQVVVRDKDLTVGALKGHLGSTSMPMRLAITEGKLTARHRAAIDLNMKGAYNDTPFGISLVGGTLSELVARAQPWPVKLTTRTAGATLRVDGEVGKTITKGLNLTVQVHGKQFKKLEPLIGADLPALGSYEFSGRVRSQEAGYTLTNLRGRIGDAGALVHGVIAKGKVVLPRAEPITLDLEGTYRNTPFTVSLIGGLFTGLTEPSKPWPIQAVVTGADATLNVVGNIKRPTKGDGFDLQFDVDGKEVKALGPVIGVALPALGPYKVSGRMLATDTGYRITSLAARIDRTDISGTLDLVSKGLRRHLTATLKSETVDIEKLLEADERVTANGQRPAFLDLPVPVDMLRTTDARLDLAIKQVRGGRVPISDVSVVATLENGKLNLTPLHLALPGASIQGRVQLDASTANPLLVVDLATGGIDIGKVVDALADNGRLSGTADSMHLNLSTSGATLEALLQNADSALTLQSVDAGYGVADSRVVIPIQISKAVATTSTGRPIEVSIDGAFRKSPFSLRTVGDRLIKLVASQEEWSMTVTARIGGATVEAKGVVTRPFAEQDLDFQFTLSGADLDTLDPVLNIDMPTIGPYRLMGRIAERAGVFRLAELEMNLEDNHATGNLKVTTIGPRPHIVASLEADKLHLEDLFEEIEEYAEKKKIAKKEDITKAEDGRLIPDVAVPVKLLRSVDLDVALNVTDVFVGRTDLGDVIVKAKLENGRLLLSPFKGKLAGGELSIELDVDTTEDTPVVSFQLSGQQIDYGALLKAFEVTDLVESVLDVEIDLSGRGTTLRGLLEHANGLIVLISGPGTIGRGGLDLWGANLLAGIMRGAAGALKTKEETRLNCMVWPFDIKDGVAQSEAILIDMSRTSVGGTGSINFGTEELDLLLKPARKRRTFLSVGPPVRVAGTLSNFDFRIEGKKRLFGRLLLPFINPAFLLVTTEAGTGERNPCVAAIAGEDTRGESPEERRGLIRRFLEQFKSSEEPSGAQSGVER